MGRYVYHSYSNLFGQVCHRMHLSASTYDKQKQLSNCTILYSKGLRWRLIYFILFYFTRPIVPGQKHDQSLCLVFVFGPACE